MKNPNRQYAPADLADLLGEVMLETIADPTQSIVCDIACGTGRLLRFLAKKGARCFGIDPDKNNAEATARIIGKENVRHANILDAYPHLPRNWIGFANISVNNPPCGLVWEAPPSSPYSPYLKCLINERKIQSHIACIEIAQNILVQGGWAYFIIPQDVECKLHSMHEVCRVYVSNLYKREYGVDTATTIVIAWKWAYSSYSEKNALSAWRKDSSISFDYAKEPLTKLKSFLLQRVRSFIKAFAAPQTTCYELWPLPIPQMGDPEILGDNTIKIEITTRLKVKASPIAAGLLAWLDEACKIFSPIDGTTIGFRSALLEPASLLFHGLPQIRAELKAFGFNVIFDSRVKQIIAQKQARYRRLLRPLEQPQAHQLLAYFECRPYTAINTVKDEQGHLLWIKGKRYRFQVRWQREQELVDIEHRNRSVVTTECNRGYMVLRVKTETMWSTPVDPMDRSKGYVESQYVDFSEKDEDKLELLMRGFALPVVASVEDCYMRWLSKRKNKRGRFMDCEGREQANAAVPPIGGIPQC